MASCVVVAALAAAALALSFPWLLPYRDSSFYRAPPSLTLAGKFSADEAGWSVRRWRAGTVMVRHEAATLVSERSSSMTITRPRGSHVPWSSCSSPAARSYECALSSWWGL